MSDPNSISSQVTNLRDLLGPILEPLEQVRTRLGEELQIENPVVANLAEHAIGFQGKLLRPALLLAAATVCGGVKPEHVEFGVVVELLHGATLVHDDILDGADTRRGTATLNHQFGNESAVIFGDYLFARAFRICAGIRSHDANIMLAETTQAICEGELAQIASKFNFRLDEEAYFNIIEKKTASLFETSASLGRVGNESVDPAVVKGLAEFGRAFGTAFQMIDDCLDITGAENEMGKSLGTDIEKGKPTLPLIRLLTVATEDEQKEIISILESDQETAAKKAVLRNYFEQYAVLEYVTERAQRFAEDARMHLAPLPGGAIRDSLETLTEFSLGRRF